ncbi:PilZ domain-containing protein [Candidatus Nitrospira bockiana]
MTPRPTCPSCTTIYVKRVSRRWPIDHVLSWAFIYPFHCQLCGKRFRQFQWGVHYVSKPIDRRLYHRLPFKCRVLLRDQGSEIEGWSTDISLGGCTIETEARLQSGTIIGLALDLPELGPIEIRAAAVRSCRPPSAGLEFLEIAPEGRTRLKALMLQHWTNKS